MKTPRTLRLLLRISTRIAASLAILLLFSGCRGAGSEIARTVPDAPQLSPAVGERLASRRIFFGHQSVGADILAGIEDLNVANPHLAVRVVPASRVPQEGGFLLQARLGTNGDPRSKIDAFARAVREGAGRDAQIALFKLCYIDFLPQTEVEDLFAHYRRTMEELRSERPDLTIVHVTAPLTRRQSGWKANIKRTLGRPPSGVEDNLARNRFNSLLRSEYLGREPVFDLAQIESTWPDGQRETFTENGETGYALVPAYTDDGGHLNVKGRQRAAAALLEVLAEAPLPSE